MNAAATPFMELRNDITSSFKITLDFDMDNLKLKTLLIYIYVFLIPMYDDKFSTRKIIINFSFHIYLR